MCYFQAISLAAFSVCDVDFKNQQHPQRAPRGPRDAGIRVPGSRHGPRGHTRAFTIDSRVDLATVSAPSLTLLRLRSAFV